MSQLILETPSKILNKRLLTEFQSGASSTQLPVQVITKKTTYYSVRTNTHPCLVLQNL